jgi:hypothetical protein
LGGCGLLATGLCAKAEGSEAMVKRTAAAIVESFFSVI